MSRAIDFWIRSNSPFLGLNRKRCVSEINRQNCFKAGVLLSDSLYLYLAEGKVPGKRGSIFALIAYNPLSKTTLWQKNYTCLDTAIEQCQLQVAALALPTPCQQSASENNAA
ncbi:MAG: hypothetical protein OIF51_12510 [Cellvibrionaceae bacterium]|nr:hypothetical protein [Cellvibrionaceae bacterium]